MCRWHATCHWKALDKGYNFGLDPIPIGGLHKKLSSRKVAGFLALAILGLLGQKVIQMPFSWGGTEYTIRGKVVASPEFGPWWVLWVRGRPWLVLAPKVFPPCANQLVCWFCLGWCEWVNCLSLFLVPSRSSNTPLYPSKVLGAKELGSVPRAPNLSIVSILRLSLSLLRGLGASQYNLQFFSGHRVSCLWFMKHYQTKEIWKNNAIPSIKYFPLWYGSGFSYK
jgi:hypothetical protein